jgi:hypothetical protein
MPRAQLLSRRPYRIGVLLLAVLSCAALRLAHLEADTPINVGTGSMGLYIDEGYKTLAARNTVQFGASRWHPEDEYVGWQYVSRLTHWPFVAAFRLFGVELGSARLVTIAYFFGFLLLYAFVGTRDRSTGHLLAGIVLLSLSYVLFFFSRVALLEVPIAALIFGVLFMLRAPPLARARIAIPLIVGATILTTFGIKRSAFLYLVPVVLGYVVATVVAHDKVRSLRVWAPGALAFLVLIAYLTRTAWVWRIDISPGSYVRKIFVNPTTSSVAESSSSSVLLICLGLLCALHLVVRLPREVVSDPYRCALLSMVTLGPALLAFFAYTPLRYYVPLLPAYVLLFLEWWALLPRLRDRADESLLVHLIGIPFFGWVLFVAGLAFNEFVLYRIPLALGDNPGISVPVFYRLFLPTALVVAIAGWRLRARILSARVVSAAVAILLVAVIARDLWVVGRFLASPSYQSREIGASLEAIVGPTASIAGDIAPFFAIGTQMHALLVAPYANRPDSNRELQPDFFQFSETNEGRRTRELLLQRPGTALGPALYRSEYAGRAVSLHRILYGQPTSEVQLDPPR